MANTSGIGLKEPDQMNWDNYNPGSKFVPPPPAKDEKGNNIIYYGQVPQNVGDDSTLEVTDEGYRQFVVDPVKIVKSGAADGYEIRFTRHNVKKFERNGKAVDASSTGNYLRSCGVLAKPQKNTEYEAAVKTTRGKVFPFTLDWTAYNKDTGEKVNGYENFPEDPERPGQRKAVLKAGDTYTERDKKGNITGTFTVKSDVLFANARVKYFIDPTKGR